MGNNKFNITIEKPSILLVEGPDDRSFFEALLRYLAIQSVQIKDVSGKDNFSYTFEALLNAEGGSLVKNIGFVRDADKPNAQAAFKAICSILNKNKYPCPAEIGKMIESDGKKVNIFIMPNNNDSGMLENLCINSIREIDILHCIDCFIKCYAPIISNEKHNVPKATILAYLSTRVPVVNTLGVAAQQKVWDFSHECFNQIKAFLFDLFG